MWFSKFLTKARESAFPPFLPFLLLSFLSVSLQSIPGRPWTHYVTRMTLNFWCWDCRGAPSSRFMLCWEWTQHPPAEPYPQSWEYFLSSVSLCCRTSCNPDWPWTHQIAMDDLVSLVVLLLTCPKFWDFRYSLSHPLSSVHSSDKFPGFAYIIGVWEVTTIL